MLPSLVAEQLRRTLTEFLSTTFALTDDDMQAALTQFLEDPDHGIFRGPFVRVRLPFRTAGPGWRDHLEWAPAGFVPYLHQAKAFERLDSRVRRPLPTLVTTGTGSGKTESFLLPVLDHCRRSRADGRTGIKALLLYPMNALANDQARRIAQLIAADAALAGLTVGLYAGDSGDHRSMSAENVIENRDALRAAPPDILMTNYKMLDYLLLRPEDAGLWEASRDSLQYLVLDEFHTYDGAQGTDVSMLLRRLGSTLGVAREGRPLGDVTPVATSATLGSGRVGLQALLTFAGEVFGEEVGPDAVVGEDRVDADEWLAGTATAGSVPVQHLARLAFHQHDDAGRTLDQEADLAEALFTGRTDAALAEVPPERPDPVTLADTVRANPLTRALLDRAGSPVALDILIEQIAPEWTVSGRRDRQEVRRLMSGFLALVSEARTQRETGETGPLLQVDVQLWLREVRRLLRRVSPDPALRWDTDTSLDGNDIHLPAVYCRHCGRSGWAALRPPAGDTLVTTPATIWAETLVDRGRVVALVHAPGEEAADPTDPSLRWFDATTATLSTVRPSDDESVVCVLEPPEKEFARRDRCPSCEQDDGIRFLGSRVATLVSVVLGHLFGSPDLAAEEKKTLVFTDSVQDASHRAAFIENRAFALNQRAVIARALDEQERTLDTLGERMVEAAVHGSQQDRYALLPPDLHDRADFAAFWQDRNVLDETRQRVRERLQLAATLEFGLSSRTGRSLPLTGTVSTRIRVGSERALLRDLEAATAELLSPRLDVAEAPSLRPWMWGVLERIRAQGGIEHPAFARYILEDGNRWSIWGGRDTSTGMPAFPRGRPAPSYPVSSAPAGREPAFEVITSTRGWYADWTKRCLGVPPQDAPLLVRALLDTLARRGVLTQRSTSSGALVWLLPPDRISLSRTGDTALGSGKAMLRCDACAQPLPTGTEAHEALLGEPCLRGRCPGRYRAHQLRPDYYRSLYRSEAVRRIVTHEHTGLLDNRTRAALEESFKRPRSADAPNVLVCTPTLELGIDIGDLSVVALTSLPRSTAAYLQRVGRAGRQTGSALVVSVLPSRPLELRRLADPLSMIAGEVVPPACHLDADEILQRQYLAFLVDRQAQQREPAPGTMAEVIGGGLSSTTWLGRLLATARADAAATLSSFLDLFGDRVSKDTAAALGTYVGLDAPDAVPPMEAGVARAVDRWRAEDLGRKQRIAALATEVDRLEALGDHLDEEATSDRRRVRGELRRARVHQRQAQQEYWLGGLARLGLLPNYALLDDSTTLDVSLWWTDEETGASDSVESSYTRGSRTALSEMAPGAVFYVSGSALHVDAVDLGTPGNPLTEQWRVCPACGWSARDTGPVSCPRCGNAKAADTGQVLTVVLFRGASAYEPRDAALAGDSRDDREKARFSVVTGVDVTPGSVRVAWRLADYPFGAEFSRDAEVRWLNVGPDRAGGATRTLFGDDVAVPLFRACISCGVVPAAQPAKGRGRRSDVDARHRGWCAQRRQHDPNGWVDVALTHHVRTQAIRLLVPPVVIADETLLVSFRAALLLGLRELLGGDPDHLDVVTSASVADGQRRHVLVLHDLVPGGTGYLAQIADADGMRRLLDAARAKLDACPCADEPVLACHRCLLAYVAPFQADAARRDRALELLTDVLEAWEPAPIGTIEEIHVQPHESPLELRFRDALRRWVESRGGRVTESVSPGGPRWDFALEHRGTRTSWSLEPQVALGGVQLDFVVRAAGRPLKIAVFTDGERYHSSPEHNRIADDATKREGLRDHGWVVWALTHDDIDAFTATETWWADLVTPDVARTSGLRWASATTVQAYLGAARSVLAQHPGGAVDPQSLTGDAMTVLLRLLLSGATDLWTWPARALALTAARNGVSGSVYTAQAPTLAAALARGEHPPAPQAAERQGWWTTTEQGAGVVLLKRAEQWCLDSVVCVDDRPQVVGSPEQTQAWRDWLSLGNLLQLTGDGYLRAVTTSTSGTAGGAVPPPVGVSPIEEHLRKIVAQTDDAVHHLVERLDVRAAADVVIGWETDEGLPVELAWPDRRIAVLVDDDGELHEWLRARDWTVVRAGADDDLTVLQREGLTTA